MILDALARDPFGIAVSNPHYANGDVKPVALAESAGNFVAATRKSVENRTYPLTRSVYVYFYGDPANPYSSKIVEFLRYVLSRSGQQDVVREGTYLPLTQKVVEGQLKILNRYSSRS